MDLSTRVAADHLVLLVDNIKNFLGQNAGQTNELIQRHGLRPDLWRDSQLFESLFQFFERPFSFEKLEHHFSALGEPALDDPGEDWLLKNIQERLLAANKADAG